MSCSENGCYGDSYYENDAGYENLKNKKKQLHLLLNILLSQPNMQSTVNMNTEALIKAVLLNIQFVQTKIENSLLTLKES